MKPYFNPEIETMPRDDLDALIDARIKYTVNYAFKTRHFIENGLKKKILAFLTLNLTKI